MKIIVCMATLVLCISTAYSQKHSAKGKKVGETSEVKDKNIDWEYFDSTSKFSIAEIKSEDLQGLWKAYKGLYRFGDIINLMNLTEPAIIEVRNNEYRRNVKSRFEGFTITANHMMPQEKNEDMGIINKISDTEFTITWKDGLNYTRYYYTR